MWECQMNDFQHGNEPSLRKIEHTISWSFGSFFHMIILCKKKKPESRLLFYSQHFYFKTFKSIIVKEKKTH